MSLQFVRKEILVWVGVVGLAINFLALIDPIINLADWARYVVLSWEQWSQNIWQFLLSWTNYTIPKNIASFCSAILFLIFLAVGSSEGKHIFSYIEKESKLNENNNSSSFILKHAFIFYFNCFIGILLFASKSPSGTFTRFLDLLKSGTITQSTKSRNKEIEFSNYIREMLGFEKITPDIHPYLLVVPSWTEIGIIWMVFLILVAAYGFTNHLLLFKKIVRSIVILLILLGLSIISIYSDDIRNIFQSPLSYLMKYQQIVHLPNQSKIDNSKILI